MISLRQSRALTMASALVIACVHVVLAQSVGAQTLRGRVYNLASGAGVPGAEVSLFDDSGPVATAKADSSGLFLIHAPRLGAYRLIARKVGYHGGSLGSVRLATRDTFELVARLEPIINVMETLKVEGKRAGLDFTDGFEERRKRGLGSFIGPEEIARRGFQRAPDLVYGIPGMQVVVDASSPGMQVTRILSTRASGLGPCEPALFVDNIQVSAEDLFRDYTSANVEAVEIYSVSEAPARFKTGRSLCGVILFWTKSRAGKDR